jgi:hypothetical protein
MTVTASTISGILKKAGFRRANRRGTSWSSGFEVGDFGRYVRVTYASVNSGEQLKTLKAMADLINGRPEKKYWAWVGPMAQGVETLVMRVEAYDETDPEQNEIRKGQAQEKLADDHPAAPAIADVKKALRTYSQYDAEFYHFGWLVGRLAEDSRLVRIQIVEAAHTTYETDRDQHIAQTLANYARVVRQAGFEFQIRDDEMSVIVAMPGEWDNALTVETVTAILRSAYAPYSTKTGGFVVRDYRKDNGALRVEYYNGIGSEQEAHDTVECYGRILVKAGYDGTVDFQDAWSLLVKLPEESVTQEATEVLEDDEQVRQALLTLRDLVEADSQFASTRRAGDHSIFVMAFSTRVEVFYSNGEYKTKGRFGKGDWRRFPVVNSELLDFIVAELNA